VDRGVLATASELFEARHYPGVVAMVSDALDDEPDCVPLLLIRARAHIALRRDLDAQADLRDLIRLDPQCSLAYRLLGELAARRDENESAAIFFREALRLDPGDREAADWLLICDASIRPAAAAHKLPAPAAAAGRFPPARGPQQRAMTSTDGGTRTLSSPARADQRPGRFARGTYPPGEDAPTEPQLDRPTTPFAAIRLIVPIVPMLARGSAPSSQFPAHEAAPLPPPPQAPKPHRTLGSEPRPEPAPMLVLPRAATAPAPRAPTAPPAMRIASPRPITRGSTPELPGFGEYLVTAGILSRERLRAAQAYQRSMRVQLSTAIVTLGLATPQRIEWAAVSHQSQLARERQQG
jgi:hypothetical protein